MEEAFLRLSDYPGLTAFGLFRPGTEVGTTDLLLNVQEEQRFEASVTGDNYGLETTGEYRAYTDLAFNNMLGVGDRLSANVMQTFDPTDSTYGRVGYEVPLGTPKYLVGVELSRNSYELSKEFNRLNIEGDTDIGRIYFKDSFIRSRDLNLSGTVDFSKKIADVDLDDDSLCEDDLSVFGAELGFDHVDSRFAGINQGTVRVNAGAADFLGSMNSSGDDEACRQHGDDFKFISGSFAKVTGRLARLQSITANHTILLRLEGQYTDDELSSLEQWSMGGPVSVRAYSVSEFLRDKAVFASAEWIANAPFIGDKPAFANRTWGEVLQLSAFYDYARGKNNDQTPAVDETGKKIDAEETLKGVGASIQLNLPDRLFARLDVARRLGGDKPKNNDNTQYWFTLTYEFF